MSTPTADAILLAPLPVAVRYGKGVGDANLLLPTGDVATLRKGNLSDPSGLLSEWDCSLVARNITRKSARNEAEVSALVERCHEARRLRDFHVERLQEALAEANERGVGLQLLLDRKDASSSADKEHIGTLEEALSEAGAELLATRDERNEARGQLMESRRISEERHADLQALAQKLGCDPTREAMVWAIDGLRADMDNLDASHVTERETFARLLAEDRSSRRILVYAACAGWGISVAFGVALAVLA